VSRGVGAYPPRLAFAVLSRVSSLWLRRRGPAVDFGGRYLSAMVRPAEPVARALAAAGDTLRALDGTHHFYPPPSIHVTLLNLDPWVDGPDAEARTLAAVRAALAETPPFVLQVEGLGASRSTVFAKVLAPTGAVVAARRRLLARLGRPLQGRPWASSVIGLLGLSFANLVRFRGPIAPALLDRVDASRHQRFGEFQAQAVEVVRTNKVLTEGVTEWIARVPLVEPPC
jgi:hypothetical protein